MTTAHRTSPNRTSLHLGAENGGTWDIPMYIIKLNGIDVHFCYTTSSLESHRIFHAGSLKGLLGANHRKNTPQLRELSHARYPYM